jgi:hypothetical protein
VFAGTAWPTDAEPEPEPEPCTGDDATVDSTGGRNAAAEDAAVDALATPGARPEPAAAGRADD